VPLLEPEPEPGPDPEPLVAPVTEIRPEHAVRKMRARLKRPKRTCDRRSFNDSPLLNLPLTSIVRDAR
jgi:hypothetical protein